MSQPSIPNITPNISLSRDDAVNLVLSSIAMEEMGMSHILNAEGEKLQYVLGTLPGLSGPPATISDLLAVNNSVKDMVNAITKNEYVLQQKMEAVTSIPLSVGPQGPPGPTGPAGIDGGNSAFLNYNLIASILEFTNGLSNQIIALASIAGFGFQRQIAPTIDLLALSTTGAYYPSGPVIIPFDGVVDSVSFTLYLVSISQVISGFQATMRIRLYETTQTGTVISEIPGADFAFAPQLTSSSSVNDTFTLSLSNLNIPIAAGHRIQPILYATSNMDEVIIANFATTGSILAVKTS